MKILEKIGTMLKSEPEYNEAYALEQMIALQKNEAALSATQAEISDRMNAITLAFEPKIKAFNVAIKEATDNLRAYADAHGALFAKSKSIKIGTGKIGWRSSSALQLQEGWDWAKVAEKCQKVYPLLAKKRTVVDLDKAKLKELAEDKLVQLGCVLEVKEEFFAKAK